VARHAQRGQPPDTICGFKRGTLFRAALDVLRTTTAPMPVTEIVGAMLAAKGVKDATAKQRKGIEAGVRCSFREQREQGRGACRGRGAEAVEARRLRAGDRSRNRLSGKD
jgi:hypothetical protein